ncbi:unnamed protein product [Strongylus vulgaris]|uniref:Uncharacterized protein n=1 Tax=Strongylus vulgaris TaxID=40348 RepID=A0A3P7IMS1_STRVU|nr:unnamed protein product [Strongylus vulgaris]
MIRHRMDPGINAKLLNHFGRTEEEDIVYEDYEQDPETKSPIYGDSDLEALELKVDALGQRRPSGAINRYLRLEGIYENSRRLPIMCSGYLLSCTVAGSHFWDVYFLMPTTKEKANRTGEHTSVRGLHLAI